MVEFQFNPPLKLNGGAVIATLDDAADFVRRYTGTELLMTRATVLQWLEDAKSPTARKFAASVFRTWAKAEGLLSKVH